jgi:nucleotide-binding universal stress UspA family protein
MTGFRRILCPVDFSDASRHALDLAIAIAGWYESHITAVYAVEPAFKFEPPILFAEHGGLDDLPVDRDRLQSQLNDWLAAATTASVPWDAKICDGRPADSVIALAKSLPADLIVMGTHGRSGFERLVLGSVTEKVLRNAGCPVLTVPPRVATTAKPPFTRLVCAFDFSEPALGGLEAALSIAGEADARLTVLNVIDWPHHHDATLVEISNDPALLAHVEQRLITRVEAFIPYESRVRSRPDVKVRIGKAYREIVKAAEDLAADLIVIGVHGRTELALTLFGSTTNQVVRRASCPVLTIRARH